MGHLSRSSSERASLKAVEKEVGRLKLELNGEKSFSYRMQDQFQRYHRIAKHLAGRELAHVQRMEIKGQLWRVSNHCKTQIEFYLSKAYGEMRADEGHPLANDE